MNALELTSFITLLANAISKNISDDDVLALLGSIFTQLGDTITTISLRRSICAKFNENGNNTSNKNSSDSISITTKY